MKRLSWLSVVMVMVGCGARPPVAPSPLANTADTTAPVATSPVGSYRTKHPVMIVCDSNADGWCEEVVEDTLTIREGHDGGIAVAIELLQTNAHMCSFEGELAPAPPPRPGEQRWTFHGTDAESPCDLSLERSPSKLVITSEGCREYCGARASLDATFATH